MFLDDRGYMSEHDDIFIFHFGQIETEKMPFEHGMHALKNVNILSILGKFEVNSRFRFQDVLLFQASFSPRNIDFRYVVNNGL